MNAKERKKYMLTYVKSQNLRLVRGGKILFLEEEGVAGEEKEKVSDQRISTTCVADPDPNPEGSVSFFRIQIRSPGI
jgi:hypothetical protein